MRFSYVVQRSSPAIAHIFPNQSTQQPLIKIVIGYQERKHKLLALIDSGADLCLFPRDVAEILGIDVPSGEKAIITGIGGNRLPFYFHEIEMLFDQYHVTTKAGFSTSSIGASGLLGQRGFFDHFVVSFDHTNGFIDIKKPNLFYRLTAGLRS